MHNSRIEAGANGAEHGRPYDQALEYGQSIGRSVCGAASRHPWLTAAALGGVAAVAVAAFAGWRFGGAGEAKADGLPEAGEQPGAPNYVVTEDGAASPRA